MGIYWSTLTAAAKISPQQRLLTRAGKGEAELCWVVGGCNRHPTGTSSGEA